MKPFYFLVALLLLSVVGMGQKDPSPLFKSGDRVCFVGNSITNNGEFYHQIFLYEVTRFPNKDISFFNCGISGDVCSGVLKRMDWDVLSHQPTHAVIKLGMNDVLRSQYGAQPTTNPDTLAKREMAIKNYKQLLDSIVRLLMAKQVKVILQTPTIYEQKAQLKRENNLGVNDALKQCADYIQGLAKQYQLPVVDYWTLLNSLNEGLQAKDPNATIVGPDRVHPGTTGHLVMAYQFLKTFNEPQFIAQIAIEKNEIKSNKTSKDCIISDWKENKKEILFTVKENALPFPYSKDQQQGMDLVPFIQDLSLEQFTVNHSLPERVQLFIDSISIGIFTREELNKGINLATYHQSPQYVQAEKVRGILNNMWKNVAMRRTIDYVEFKHLTDYKGDKADIAAIKAYLDNLFATKLSDTPFYKTQFDAYIKNKPNQKTYEQEIIALKAKAYEAAQPVAHRFVLKPAP